MKSAVRVGVVGLLAGAAIGFGAARATMNRYVVQRNNAIGSGYVIPREVMHDRWTGRTWERVMRQDWREVKRQTATP